VEEGKVLWGRGRRGERAEVVTSFKNGEYDEGGREEQSVVAGYEAVRPLAVVVREQLKL